MGFSLKPISHFSMIAVNERVSVLLDDDQSKNDRDHHG